MKNQSAKKSLIHFEEGRQVLAFYAYILHSFVTPCYQNIRDLIILTCFKWF